MPQRYSWARTIKILENDIGTDGMQGKKGRKRGRRKLHRNDIGYLSEDKKAFCGVSQKSTSEESPRIDYMVACVQTLLLWRSLRRKGQVKSAHPLDLFCSRDKLYPPLLIVQRPITFGV